MLTREKLKENIWSILFFIALAVLLVILVHLINTMQKDGHEKGKIVGGVFIGSLRDGGWNQSHYEGLRETCDELGLTLETVEYVKEQEEDCQKAVDELVEKGASVIFLTSDGFGDNVRTVIESYPDIMFYTISPESTAKNVATYYGRMYQMRYLAGMLAGWMTRTNVLGYVAGMDTPQVDRGVNAYLLGARSVNPDVVVKMRLTGTWFDSGKERQAAAELIEKEGADVLTNHSSTANTVDVAEEKGVYSIGYNCMKTAYSDHFLASLTFHWNVLYRAILKDYLRGSVVGKNSYWWGTEEGVVGIEKFSPVVNRKMKRQLSEEGKRFEKGFDVFLGEVKRADGKVMCRKDERISDESLLFDMNWLVEGVELCDE